MNAIILNLCGGLCYVASAVVFGAGVFMAASLYSTYGNAGGIIGTVIPPLVVWGLFATLPFLMGRSFMQHARKYEQQNDVSSSCEP